MKLSAPLYVLKSQAKGLKAALNLTLGAALDLVAQREGFATWSLLVAKSGALLPCRFEQILGFLNEGDLVLVGGRPRAGKTLFSVGLLAQAQRAGHPAGCFFTLVEREQNVLDRLGAYNFLPRERSGNETGCLIDCSDNINASYIVATARPKIQRGSLLVVDYLQILDEKRSSPPLQEQVAELKSFAKDTGCIVLFMSQLNRYTCDAENGFPTIADVRLPNPLDLGLFNKIVFLRRRQPDVAALEVCFAGQDNRSFEVGVDLPQGRIFDLR